MSHVGTPDQQHCTVVEDDGCHVWQPQEFITDPLAQPKDEVWYRHVVTLIARWREHRRRCVFCPIDVSDHRHVRASRSAADSWVAGVDGQCLRYEPCRGRRRPLDLPWRSLRRHDLQRCVESWRTSTSDWRLRSAGKGAWRPRDGPQSLAQCRARVWRTCSHASRKLTVTTRHRTRCPPECSAPRMR